MKKLFNQITWQLCCNNSSWWVFSCSIAAGFWIKRYLKNTSSSWLLWLLLLQVNSLSQVYSEILSRFSDCFLQNTSSVTTSLSFVCQIYLLSLSIIHRSILPDSCFSKRLLVRFSKKSTVKKYQCPT